MAVSRGVTSQMVVRGINVLVLTGGVVDGMSTLVIVRRDRVGSVLVNYGGVGVVLSVLFTIAMVVSYVSDDPLRSSEATVGIVYYCISVQIAVLRRVLLET